MSADGISDSQLPQLAGILEGAMLFATGMAKNGKGIFSRDSY
jgi:hypothetical protein